MTIEIDGAMGEGGGQVLRTSLTLAMVTGQSIAVSNIRAGRKRPGLLRQHLTAVRAAAEISSATVSGDQLGSMQIEFAPKPVTAGDYCFRIGTAGSTTLLVQTILPALALAGSASTISVEGGTHNGMAPSVDFIQIAYLPALAKMGLRADANLERHGFYPNGGGSWHIGVQPWAAPVQLTLTDRGSALCTKAIATISGVPRHVAERELERVARKLRWSSDTLEIAEVMSQGPGNVLSLQLAFEHVTEVCEAVGAVGVSAERVAGNAIRLCKHYLAGEHPVGEYLADQLLVPMVLGCGGEFVTGTLSEHTRTNIQVIERMLSTSLINVAATNNATTISIPRGFAMTG